MNIDKLHEYAVRFKKLGLPQVAGDIDYLIAWLKSPEFNNGFHLPPHPAGENTYDEYSHHCPIPFTASRDTVKSCNARLYAAAIIEEAGELIASLKSIYTDELEIVALDSYIEYMNKVKDLLDEEELLEWTSIFPEMGTASNEDVHTWFNNDNDPNEL